MTSHGKEVYCRQMLFGVWRLTSFDILPAVTHCVARGAAMLACWCWVCVLWIWRLEFLLQKIISFTIRSPVFLCSGCGHAQTKTKLRTDINEAECVCIKILNWPEMCHLVARVHALVHWGRSSSCTCMWVFFLFFLGYRGGLFSGPRSLPIPRQVHMCFISRQACWTVNSDSRAGLGIRSAASLKPIAENKRQAQLFFFSLAESKKKSPNIFLFLDIQVTYTPHPHLFFAVPLYVPASHYDLLSSPQNWFIPRPTLHPHAAAHANSFGLFFYVSVSLLSSSAPVFFFFLQPPAPPTHPHPFSLSFDSVCAGSPGFVPVYLSALRYCVCRGEEKERGGARWPRDELLTLLLRRHAHRHRRKLFHTHHHNPVTYHWNLCELANFPLSFLSINMTITIRAWHGRSRPRAPPMAPWSPDTLLGVCTLSSTVLAQWKWWLKP